MVDSFHSTRFASFTGTPKPPGAQRRTTYDTANTCFQAAPQGPLFRGAVREKA